MDRGRPNAVSRGFFQRHPGHVAKLILRYPDRPKSFFGAGQERFGETPDPISVGAVEMGVVLHGVQPLVVLVETERTTPVDVPTIDLPLRPQESQCSSFPSVQTLRIRSRFP